MGRREFVIKKLKEFLFNVSKDFKIEKVIFFGSRVTGKATKESDIDLIIISEGFKDMNFIERAARMYDYWNISYAVDFLCYTPEEFDALKKRVSIVKHALEEGIAIK